MNTRFINYNYSTNLRKKSLAVAACWFFGKICVFLMQFFRRVMCPKYVDGMANSVDPDQTPPWWAVWSGSSLFIQTCVQKLGIIMVI